MSEFKENISLVTKLINELKLIVHMNLHVCSELEVLLCTFIYKRPQTQFSFFTKNIAINNYENFVNIVIVCMLV